MSGVALFGGSRQLRSARTAPLRGVPAASGRARPERDGSEPASGRRTRHAAVAELLLDRSNATLQRRIDETKPWPRKHCEGTALRSDATLQCMGRALLCISSPSPLGPKTNQKSALRFVASSRRTEPEGDLPPRPRASTLPVPGREGKTDAARFYIQRQQRTLHPAQGARNT
ncbi:hypothetical protein NDU88_004295 [Pleurodeles waltl]|uniref:Uncharacterized protein n=1 Tax=Pleurodeles waltl TaxID=8319 RepID=A0AAV7SID6_PLEWA|nr:hypothetical protein NDU88_004295 [Pleurodeles waltl]